MSLSIMPSIPAPPFPALARTLAFAVLASLTVAHARADIVLPSVISDGMVLQRNESARLWGWADPGEHVSATASWSEDTVQTEANERGRWMLELDTPSAGGPHTVTLRARNTITINDVLIGEVWVASGQSNMEWPLRATDNAEQAIAEANHPDIRLFQVPNTFSLHPRFDSGGSWQACTPESTTNFSAVAYYFARELHRELGVPIGVIGSEWGGTLCEAWTSAEGLEPFEAFAGTLQTLEAIRNPDERGDATRLAQTRWWRSADRRSPEGWTEPDFDDSDWDTIALPGDISAAGLGGHDGFVHFRRPFKAPLGEPGGAVVEFAGIDDRDEVWINGQLIGGTRENGAWNSPRRYEVEVGVLRAGDNVIAVRMLDTGGAGGFGGPAEAMKITVGDATIPLAGQWRLQAGATMSELPSMPQGPNINQNTPTALFNGMIEPIAPFMVRGAIWYQGESNRNRGRQYRELFPAMIADWRREWGRTAAQFPFYYVQIAPFNYGNDRGQAAELREAQLMTMDNSPNTGMAVITDIGNVSDIHPRNKLEVGRRLSLWALSETYGRDVVPSGPIYRGVRFQGNRAIISFDYAEGLQSSGGELTDFVIAGPDRVFHEARAEIRTDQGSEDRAGGTVLTVWSDAVKNPAAVRFGWSAIAEPNLVNGAGLPASPFRTDDWDADTGPLGDAGRTQYLTDDPDFVPLFNGRNLDGWANVNCADSTWQVKDNMIVCSGIPTGVMRTDRMYENFVLELEYRHLAEGGNAGLFVWSDALTARGQPFTRSVEVQVMDGEMTDWYTCDGDIFPIHGAKMTPLNEGAIIQRAGNRAYPTEKRANRAPQWNHYRVTCNDGEISLAVNGKVVTRGKEASPRKGYICLEAEGSPVHFRNIKIKELPSTNPSTSEVATAAQGFRTLYNGVDFTGWKHGPDHEGHWRAADWKMVFDGNGPDLWSQESYGDFVLICDWRWTGESTPTMRQVILPSGSPKRNDAGEVVMAEVQDAGDSGIYLRGSSKSQVNMWCWPIGSGEVYGYRTDGSMPPEVRAGVTPSEAADAPIGRWNRFIITMKGDRLTVELNGVAVIKNAQLPGVAESGPIALQNHGAPIEFANIYIRQLR